MELDFISECTELFVVSSFLKFKWSPWDSKVGEEVGVVSAAAGKGNGTS